jgi:flagellar FliJ protein
MTKPFPMQTLVDLAQRKHEAATRKFGHLNRQQQAAQAKLDSLLQFRKEYQARFQQAEKSGMSQSDLANFQGFMQRLDEAIAQQSTVNEHALNSVQAGRNEMKETQRKMKSFDTLAQRHLNSEKKQAEKAEQRQQDEHTSRTVAIKFAAAHNES